MTDESVEAVALLVLSYREMSDYSAVGPRLDGSEIVEDLEAGSPVSLLTMVGSSGLAAIDWKVVAALDPIRTEPEELPAFVAALSETDPGRAEALLHVLGPDWQKGWPVPAELVLTTVERWEEVEETVESWSALGLAATREDVFSVYLSAMEVGTGRSRDEIEDDFLDATGGH